jgi:hypothetical protein
MLYCFSRIFLDFMHVYSRHLKCRHFPGSALSSAILDGGALALLAPKQKKNRQISREHTELHFHHISFGDSYP